MFLEEKNVLCAKILVIEGSTFDKNVERIENAMILK